MSRISPLALALASVLAAPFAAAGDYQFANVSANWLDWSDGTTARTADSAKKVDFGYLELEGGLGRQWGELYGFADLENPGKSSTEDDHNNRRYVVKGVGRFNLAELAGHQVQLYAHVYDVRDPGNQFRDQNRVVGLGTELSAGGFWIKPFVGAHYQDRSDVQGWNGYMAGWVAGYSFTAFGQAFMLSNWQETEFKRKARFNSGPVGQNGAVALWWTPTPALTTGVQYRYANDKLGANTYQNGLIYSVKYNFL